LPAVKVPEREVNHSPLCCAEFKNERIYTRVIQNIPENVKIINLKPKRVWELPTSTQLRATWYTDSIDKVVLLYVGASRYHKYCIDGGTSPEYFG
jgi:hypothetical protein